MTPLYLQNFFYHENWFETIFLHFFYLKDEINVRSSCIFSSSLPPPPKKKIMDSEESPEKYCYNVHI